MSYYQRHVFFCCNQREAPEACCANHGAAEMHQYAKSRIKALGLSGKGKASSEWSLPPGWRTGSASLSPSDA